MTSSLPTLSIVINKENWTLGPSETFLRAHIEQLPFRTLAVLGNPGSRRIDGGTGAFLQSQLLAARGFRKTLRLMGLTSAEAMDERTLAAYFVRERVEVVLAEYGPTALSIADACTRAGVPLVSHFHGWDAYVLASSNDLRERYRRLFARSEAVVAVSRHMRQHLISLGASPDRVIWNPCGAQPLNPGASPASAPPLFVSIGRATPKKAVVTTLLAFAQVLAAVPTARLELVGGQPDRLTEQLVLALGIGKSVTFHGMMNHDEVLAVMCRARCYVHPSVTAPDGDMEGTPVSVLEAMASGLPVVSTRHGGILDVLDGTTGGVLVDEYDVDGTAEAMIRYATDPDAAAGDGAEGRRLHAQYWSMERSLRALALIVDAARRRDARGLAHLASLPHAAGQVES